MTSVARFPARSLDARPNALDTRHWSADDNSGPIPDTEFEMTTVVRYPTLECR